MPRDYTMDIARMESRLDALKTKAKTAARRDDSRRKILIGAAVLAALDCGSLRPDSVRAVLDRFLSAPRDRALFSDGVLAIEVSRGDAPPPAVPLAD